ncbi:PLU-1-domain-containing protein [Xylaria bambusicola]|uniref:PLU-1-domain-containing protein n=1 Tax=Xylaria bambusicola TaxID=326684 RepID=UPI0020080DF0|nr:PLU-1-domain-containing protein [Xylaria bambusicola]KAI0502965.1 PLU-1-domain-containing protein [Xylaria bambusicola]
MVSVPSANQNGSGGAGSANASSRASPAVSNANATRDASTTANGAKPKTQVNSNGYHPTNPQLPLSSMQSAPLDLRSVERRGQPTASREHVKKSRLFGLQEAPTYTPTEEEWKDPLEYVRKISPEAQAYGLCKIIPPDSWNPDFAIDTERFHFRTRKQELNSVEGSTRANLSYLDALAKFHKQQGTNLNRLPYVDKKPLDLYRLKKAVESRGGFEKVCKTKKWAEIGRDLGYSGKIMSSLSTSLKNSYDRWLNPYENYLRQAKPGVYQQLEYEYGGPLTPSPAPSPVKRSTVNTPSSLRGESPARHATDALQAGLGVTKGDVDRDNATTADLPPPIPQPTSGFTAINSGGFTAVNASFTSVNRPTPPEAKSFTPPPRRHDSPASMTKDTALDLRPASLSSANALKRQLSFDSIDSARKEASADKDDSENGSRRSKRLKKETVPTVAGSHMSLFRPSAPRVPRDETSPPGEKCDTCGKGDDAGFILVCESCDHGYHGACLDPPLKAQPDGEWNCPRCLVGDGQFGFEEGGLYSLKQFQEKAADFKQSYFESRMPFDPVLNCVRPVTEDDVEREFWKLVANIEETVEVEYGADIHCTTHGSGFPTAERHPCNPYSGDPWNLNNMPLHPDSLFRHIKTDISGMTVPWVYVGMIFSTFCWHNEDHFAYSINYQHFGATKTWYGIPAEDTEKFENAMREAVPELFETQPDLLFQLVTLLTPEHLKKAGVRVYALDQRAGQMVITFPQAYHAGFNHGFNFNEAVNFAPSDWEPYGLAGVERLQQFRRQSCFSHDELLWTAAEGPTSALTIQTAKWLAPALEKIHKREQEQREAFIAKHLENNSHACALTSESTEQQCTITFQILDEDVPEDEYQCLYCKSFTYLSRFKCLKSGKVLCLLHAGYHACCDITESQRFAGDQHVIYYRKTQADMDETHRKVAEKANMPEHWEEKYEKLLDEGATPALKTLRTLLNEGERIPYGLPSLPVLREFVDRCNDWVEEATNFTVRKQQNRRKNDKVQTWQRGMIRTNGDIMKEYEEREARKVHNIYRLIEEADRIGFDCPEKHQLKERADAIRSFQKNAEQALEHILGHNQESIEELIEEGRTFNVIIPELDKLQSVLEQIRWGNTARTNRGKSLTMDEVREIIKEGHRLCIPLYNDHMKWYNDKYQAALQWETKARELINADLIHYPQLEALSNQVQAQSLPVPADTLAIIDQILHKQREAHRQVVDLTERSRDSDHTKRPRYSEVAEVMRKVEDLNSKPAGTLDLEKEQKRHEDWMRKGKKLFGKTNAPLHILKSHMDYVYDRNLDCFDIVSDKPRVPAEPASRATSEERDQKSSRTWDDPTFREVFCICRRTEAGLMIECELCHEWYHGKCLKIARGKVKEDDKYTCPICDWRVKIPRDAARPKLEDLIAWQDEIPGLPFQPEETEVLKKIIDKAQEFRQHIAAFCTPVVATASEADTQRFYLRKIEGAEILLSYETNFFRQELHKWAPVAPQPPPVLDVSKSTRKPRPTKLQKLLTQYGVDDPDDLPEAVKGKANSLKRKAQNAEAAAAAAAAVAPPSASLIPPHATSPSTHSFGSSGHAFFRGSQPSTPALTATTHGHPPPSAESVTSSRPTSSLRPDSMDIDGGSSLHPDFFMSNGSSGQGPQLTRSDSNLSLEERILQGQDDDLIHATGPDREKVLEILGKTENGRRRAEEVYGPDIWDSWRGKGYYRPSNADQRNPDDDKEVDKMFLDLTNANEDNVSKKDKRPEGERVSITAESFEAERNAMDAMEDSE